MPHNGKLYWARRCTRWDIYPQQEPVQLIAHNWEGFWCPQPDGTWYKSPASFVFAGPAYTPDLRGEWVQNGKLQEYHRVLS